MALHVRLFKRHETWRRCMQTEQLKWYDARRRFTWWGHNNDKPKNVILREAMIPTTLFEGRISNERTAILIPNYKDHMGQLNQLVENTIKKLNWCRFNQLHPLLQIISFRYMLDIGEKENYVNSSYIFSMY